MRIVIVEDEVKIREGMGKLIESQTDHMVLGEAADGEEGLEMILRFKPDLVITDIRMPKMDGLEMIRELYGRKVPVHTVILSGYSEFEYAKRAIQYGVDDYLLKPLAADDIQEMLATIEQRIKKEELTNGTPELHIRNLILGADEEMEKNCAILEAVCGLPVEGNYELFAGYIGSAAASYKEEMESAIGELKEKYQELKLHYIYIDNFQKAYLLAVGEGERLDALEKSVYNRMLLHYLKKPEQAIWIKQRFTRLSELKETVKELDRLFSYALVLKQDGWLSAGQAQEYEPVAFTAPSEIYSRIRNAICQGDTEKLKKAAGDFQRYMEEGPFEAEDIRGAFVKSYYLISDTLQDIDRGLYGHLKSTNLLRNMETAVTWNELKQAYGDVVQVVAGTKTKREDISNFVIKRAINYIREHYQEGITQEEVSRELEITPEYLSTLFNREMGINFSTFLKQFRMSHAKRLLKGTDMKIYEIAKATGYSDPKYFQRVFKEEIGVSPGDYRQMN